MPKVFLSYAKPDQDIADDICHILENNGGKCWIASRDIPYGHSYPEAIMQGIEDSDAFLLLLSENTNLSRHVLHEVERAFHKGKKIIPVSIRPCQLSKSLEYFLSTSQFFDAFEKKRDQELIKLLSMIKGSAQIPNGNDNLYDGAFSQSFGDEQFEIKEGKRITEDDLRQAIQIDAVYFADELRGNLDTCLKWLHQNPLIYTVLVSQKEHRVVGYINAMPIEDDFFNLIERGDFIDMELPDSAIRGYDFPDFLKMYFCSIAVHPSYHGTMAYKVLYDSFMKKLYHLATNDFYITEVIADAVTEKGKKMAEQLSMQYQHTTSHNSRIYKMSMMPPRFRYTTKETKRVFDLYTEKYNDFREYFDTL